MLSWARMPEGKEWAIINVAQMCVNCKNSSQALQGMSDAQHCGNSAVKGNTSQWNWPSWSLNITDEMEKFNIQSKCFSWKYKQYNPC